MRNLKEVKEYFNKEETVQVANYAADYQFVKTGSGDMFLFSNGKYRIYRTFDGFCKAVLYKIKRG